MLSTTIKPKTCQQCGSSFIPFLWMARVCSPICASRIVKAEKKVKNTQEREQFKARKAAIQRKRDLVAEAQKAFNAWVRARDADQPCISCDVMNPPMKPGGQWDAGHFMSRGAYPELRFDEDNCHKQCKTCNGGGGKFAHKARTVSEQYEERLVDRIGAETVERLKGPHEPKKWTREELIDIKATYTAKARQLKKEEA